MKTNRSSPSASIIPVLGYPDITSMSKWLSEAFGFRVRLRIGDHRVQLTLREGALILTQTPRENRQCQSVHVRVEDAASVFDRAVAKGAKVIAAIADHPYGERQFTVEDPGGHRWTFSQTIEDVDPKSWGATDVDLG